MARAGGDAPRRAGGARRAGLDDHVLERAWPGAVTGKVSDVAGPVVAAALLGALVDGRTVLVAVGEDGVLRHEGDGPWRQVDPEGRDEDQGNHVFGFGFL